MKDLLKEAINIYYVYILTNWNNEVMYIGVTNDLERRLYEHKRKLVDGFTSKYNINKLVYFESTTDIKAAIAREKQLKGWRRKKKNSLVEKVNPEWKDLFDNSDEKDSSQTLSAGDASGRFCETGSE